jgi:hypothetical protein
MKMTWNDVLKSTRGRWTLVFCFACILFNIFVLPLFYKNVIEPKYGMYLHDVFLNLFIPVNWSKLIFTIIYISVFQTLLSVARKPELILIGLTTYFAVNLLRMGTMYLLTLEPPADMIFLTDPISTKFYPDGTFAKDMFFSGHVSTMTLLVLIEKNRLVRVLKIVGTAIVALLLAWQHVHYTLDLVVAPIATYGVYLIVNNLLKHREMGRKTEEKQPYIG